MLKGRVWVTVHQSEDSAVIGGWLLGDSRGEGGDSEGGDSGGEGDSEGGDSEGGGDSGGEGGAETLVRNEPRVSERSMMCKEDSAESPLD